MDILITLVPSQYNWLQGDTCVELARIPIRNTHGMNAMQLKGSSLNPTKFIIILVRAILQGNNSSRDTLHPNTQVVMVFNVE